MRGKKARFLLRENKYAHLIEFGSLSDCVPRPTQLRLPGMVELQGQGCVRIRAKRRYAHIRIDVREMRPWKQCDWPSNHAAERPV